VSTIRWSRSLAVATLILTLLCACHAGLGHISARRSKAAAVVATGGVTSPSTTGSSRDRLPTRTCETADAAPWAGFARNSIVVGPLAFPAGKGMATLSLGQIRHQHGAKEGVFLKRGHRANVSVAWGPRDTVSLWHADPAGPTNALVACPGHSTAWSAATQFAGGFRLRGPTCVHLVVRIDGGSARKLTVPIGRTDCAI
jgi:hypothetical protein